MSTPENQNDAPGEPAEATAEQAADLAALQSAAGTGAGIPVQVQGPAAPKVDLAADLAGLVGMAVTMAGPMFPSLVRIYTPETTQAASEAVAAVCNKHGWLQDGIGGKYAVEITAAFVLGPLALATYMGIKGDLAAMAQPEQPQQAAIPAPGAATEPGALDAGISLATMGPT